MVVLNINGKDTEIDGPEDSPLLWVLRDKLAMTGTKFGCGIAACGACTVHVDNQAVKSCVRSVGSLQGKAIWTIEQLGSAEALHPVQQAWLDENVSQCGYCQPGQIMAAAALLTTNPAPSDADIDMAMAGNICRCGTYPRIRKAIKRASLALKGAKA